MGRLRLDIANKLLLGYLPMILVTVLVAAFSLVSLTRLNHIAESIVDVDVPLVEACDQLVDHLLAQDSYGRRYILLRDAELARVFRQRGDGFRDGLERIRKVRGRDDQWAAGLERRHQEYERLFQKGFEVAGELSPELDRALRRQQADIVGAVRQESLQLRGTRDQKMRRAADIGSRAFRVTTILCFLGLALAGGAALVISRGITGSVRRLKAATGDIAEGRFDQVPRIESGDELEELAQDFGLMAARLRRMEQMCLDASPLTRLPGGEAIEEELRRRLEEGAHLAFCLLDLDNFKAYSDKYGYARGSDVIKAVAHVLEEVVGTSGTSQDFIGHIGGDDFVLLTSPERCRGLCSEVIRRFDAMAAGFYTPEDRKMGYIRGKNRQGESATFPLISLSISVIEDPGPRNRDPIAIGELAARLKEHAKSIPGSVFVVDRDLAATLSSSRVAS